VFFTDTSQSDNDYSIQAQLRKTILNSIINDYHQSKKQADAELHIPAAKQKNMEFNPIAQNDTLSLMQELPDLDRIIFNLFVVDGYWHEKIAQLLRIDVSESVLRLAATRLSLNRSISTTDVPR
jgi:DNA-directed RNA polymerase specialized sigma24 family protein